jgi:stage V sporulation protein K
MPWNPTSVQSIMPLHLDLWTQVKSDLSKRGLHDRFEIDYELRFVLFVAENIDGLSQREEKRLNQAIAKGFEWSTFHLKMLEERIFRQPSFDLDQLRMCREIPSLGALAYQLALTMCLIDAKFSDDEIKFLNNLRQVLWQSHEEHWRPIDQQVISLFQLQGQYPEFLSHAPLPSAIAQEPHESVDSCLEELDALTGLQSVKDEIKRLVSFLDIQRQREQHQLPAAQLNYHMVFTGSPGTGKTTIARLVARIYRALGILKKGHLIETDRSGLVGQYIGHTEVKTNGIVDKSLDGLLFIDEAYSLVKDSENDFGHEAIDTLVKRMEDDRHRLIVIVAGYETEMKQFLSANPGLQSRFNTFIPFEDYEPKELSHIFKQLCQKNHYQLTDGDENGLEGIFSKAIESAKESFGNARYARNLFEASLRYQAFRLSQQQHKDRSKELSKDELMTLTMSDLQQGSGLS